MSDIVAYENLTKLYINFSLAPVPTTNFIKTLNDISPNDVNKQNNDYTNSKTNTSIKNTSRR